MGSFFEHLKRVALDDVRLFFAPFIGLYTVIRKEMQRPPVRSDNV